ncbi:hypothetical protein D9758_012538 [Tetrapyrgos nigripes]|uniref:Terpenoid synthase n=1 Tax=Tetrapyrgos nigripes TaxID=182062 RepID=A0A8H5G3C5_9AGAR|nr:hypothetical protein D9758_012538 [Tetrapyrgos nigripes]
MQINFTQVEALLRSFLTRAEFTYPGPCPEADAKLYKLAIEESIRRGINQSHENTKPYFGPILFNAAQYTNTSYGHLSPDLQMIICIITACLTYIDDAPHHGYIWDDVAKFQHRFIRNEAHPNTVLMACDDLLKEMYEYFGETEANIIVTSAVNVSTGVMFEKLGMKATESSYADFYRDISGAADLYSVFIFPKNLPISTYIQAIPDLRIIINQVNDVLSFYKEEKAGDNANFISFLAESLQISKVEAFQVAADKAIAAHENIMRILSPSKEAVECYQKFNHGYMAYHIYGKRYKLEELGF